MVAWFFGEQQGNVILQSHTVRDQHFLTKLLNGLFRLTSNGWSLLVQLPGMASGTVVISLNFCLTAGVKWAASVSRTSALWPSVAGSHTRSIHSSIKLSFIQAFSCTLTKTPSSLMLSGRFPLNITRPGKTSPSVVTLRVAVRCCFLLPVVRTTISLAP